MPPVWHIHISGVFLPSNISEWNSHCRDQAFLSRAALDAILGALESTKKGETTSFSSSGLLFIPLQLSSSPPPFLSSPNAQIANWPHRVFSQRWVSDLSEVGVTKSPPGQGDISSNSICSITTVEWILMLWSLSLYCSPHNRPNLERWVLEARNNDLIRKASRWRRWWARAPKNHLAWFRIQAPFILKGEGVKSNTSWFPSALGRDVLISSSLQSFTGGPGPDVSCELNRGFLFCFF